LSKRAVLLLVIALAASCILVPLTVHAGPRTIVVPDDFQTITTALNYAADGDTIFVRNGTYEFAEGQTLVISKSISLIGEDTDSTILKLHPSWVQQGLDGQGFPSYGYEYPIEIQADNVTISGFNITSEGYNNGN
jgi:hypothetical protein